MEILGPNIMTFSDTGMTGSAASTTSAFFNNIVDSDLRRAFVTYNYNSDFAAFVLVVTFGSPQVIDRIAIMGHNLKQFFVRNLDIFDFFSMTQSSGTVSSEWISNSLTSNYMMFSPVTCSSFSIQMTKTITANEEKVVGYLAVGNRLLDLSQKPGYAGYSVINKDTSISHAMANGGYRYQKIAQKTSVKIDMEYVPATLRQSFYDLYFNRQEMIFVGNPPTTTAASWDKQIFPCVWSNGFDFETYSDNCATPYFSGSIVLDEIPK